MSKKSKKIQILSTISGLAGLSAIVPIVATACNNGADGSKDLHGSNIEGKSDIIVDKDTGFSEQYTFLFDGRIIDNKDVEWSVNEPDATISKNGVLHCDIVKQTRSFEVTGKYMFEGKEYKNTSKINVVVDSHIEKDLEIVGDKQIILEKGQSTVEQYKVIVAGEIINNDLLKWSFLNDEEYEGVTIENGWLRIQNLQEDMSVNIVATYRPDPNYKVGFTVSIFTHKPTTIAIDGETNIILDKGASATKQYTVLLDNTPIENTDINWTIINEEHVGFEINNGLLTITDFDGNTKSLYIKATWKEDETYSTSFSVLISAETPTTKKNICDPSEFNWVVENYYGSNQTADEVKADFVNSAKNQDIFSDHEGLYNANDEENSDLVINVQKTLKYFIIDLYIKETSEKYTGYKGYTISVLGTVDISSLKWNIPEAFKNDNTEDEIWNTFADKNSAILQDEELANALQHNVIKTSDSALIYMWIDNTQTSTYSGGLGFSVQLTNSGSQETPVSALNIVKRIVFDKTTDQDEASIIAKVKNDNKDYVNKIDFNAVIDKKTNDIQITAKAKEKSGYEGSTTWLGVWQTAVATEEITYSELVTKRNNEQLTPGVTYRLTDYVCTSNGKVNGSAGLSQALTHQFDILILATDVNVLNENVRFIKHDGDTYFANVDLNSWEGKYCIDNDTNRFEWAVTDGTGKGVIYELKDDFGNKCPYDFKNIQFKRWKILGARASGYYVKRTSEDLFNKYFSPSKGTLNSSDNKYYWNDFEIETESETTQPIWCYTFSSLSTGGEQLDYSINKTKNVRDNVFKDARRSNNVLFLNNNVFFGNYCTSNSFGNTCNSNSFGNSCHSNSFGNNCYSNSFGNNCYSNSFGNDCYSNSFGNSCDYNSFGNDCYSNSFGNGCYSNAFGYSCDGNSFGPYCYSNSFGYSCDCNSFGIGCRFNSFGDSCAENSFGDDCYSNSFVASCAKNIFFNTSNKTFNTATSWTLWVNNVKQ